MSNANEHINLNRYPGVRPFSTTEDFLFFGRGADLEALNTLISIKQTVVLHGKSGYGKSSLINAGIIPKLKENDQWVYFSIRFNNFSETDTSQNLSPSQTFRQRLKENIDTAARSTLDQLIPDENSFWYWIKRNQQQKNRTHFIIFFDQFEELFTYPKEQVEDFSDQLSQLLYATVPVNFNRKIAELDAVNPIEEDLHNFLSSRPDVKVIYSIRSDRLSLLNLLSDRHPLILQNCYELGALSVEDAKTAIRQPAALPQQHGFETPPFTYTDAVIDNIIAAVVNKDDGKIEASTLQIVCRYVEDQLVNERKISLISDNDLGNIDHIFRQYYERLLDKLSAGERVLVQRLIEDELINSNKRNPLAASYIEGRLQVPQPMLLALEQSSLLRKERDVAGRLLYEISHDSLIVAIAEVAKARREKEKKEKEELLQQQLEQEQQKAAEWKALKDKAVRRSKLSFGLLVFSVAIAVIAVYFYRQAEKAKVQTDKAYGILNTLTDSITYENYKKSIALAQIKVELLEEKYANDPELSAPLIKEATDFLKIKDNDTIPPQLRSMRDSLERRIRKIKLKSVKQ